MFTSYHLAEKYVNDVTIKRFRDCIIRLRFGINELGINKRYVPESSLCRDCPSCRGNFNLEDEPHFLFHCPVCEEIRRKYISEFIGQDTDTDITPDVNVSRKLGMYVFCAIKMREELLGN